MRGVSLCSDVDVDSAASGVVALGTGLAKASDQLLQGFDIGVVQDRGNQFAFLAVGSVNADILLHFPLASLRVPGAPGFVSVAAGGVFVAACAKILSCKEGCFLAGDVVHLNLNSDGLLLHLFNLVHGLVCHCLYLLRFCVFVFPFGVYIFALLWTYSKLYMRHNIHNDFRRVLCISVRMKKAGKALRDASVRRKMPPKGNLF